MSARPLPLWVDVGVLPLANVALALCVAGLVVLAVGVDPAAAVRIMLLGAFGGAEGIGYTLYYATNFVFTGLAVALAFHAGLFNIGGEGQATVGGLGATLVALAGDAVLPAPLLIPLAILGAAAFGAGWAAIPGWLQAHRGSHVVVTTIMFNFIAAALMVYLLVNVLIAPGQMSPETRELGPAAQVPAVHALLDGLAVSPLNVSALGALACCAVVWLLLWHTPWGFELRALGHNPAAARYAGIDVARATVLVMAASGALAGLVGVNEILGVHHRLILNFTAGYGFGGIAVALMGRNHPIGVVLASLLFGALTQGGAELAFEIPALSRDMIVVIQGLVILFSGALATMTRPWFEGAAQRLVRKPAVA